jgi:hypothetical protein
MERNSVAKLDRVTNISKGAPASLEISWFDIDRGWSLPEFELRFHKT